jgi:nucleoside-diphosphate-sugar epimerase
MPRPGYQEVALLLGLPSFLSQRLLAHILVSEPTTLAYAIVRANALQEAERFVSGLDASQRQRVVLLEGDPASMDLGLSGAEYRSLTSEIDRIHAAAQATEPALERGEAERINVDGTSEILDLAAACRSLRCLALYSTADVAGNRDGLVHEDQLEAGQSFPTVVAETRARAEKLARQRMAKIPIAVLRPSTIVGDSQTGEIDRFDGPYLFILLMATAPPDLAIPMPAPGDAPLHLVPIDYVVRAAHAIARDPRAPGRTFHVTDPHPLAARRVFELVAEAFGRTLPRGTFPTNLARALLRVPGLTRLAKSPLAFVDQLTNDVRFDASNTRSVLAGTGIVCPAFDSYVGALVLHVKARVREHKVVLG